MQLLQRSPALLKARLDFELFDDFLWYISPHLWTSLVADTGSTCAIDADGVGGIVQLGTDTTDNDETCLASTNELALFAADKPFYAECRLQYTELTGNAANVAFGFADALGADQITDNGGAAAINSSGALIYKLDGGTVWRCNSENNAVATDTVGIQTAGGASYQTLAIEVVPVDATNVEITYFVDTRPITDSRNRPIKHTVAYASATEMDFGVYMKTGTTEALTVNVDYIYFARRR